MRLCTQRFCILTLLFICSTLFTHTTSALQAGEIDPSFLTGVPAGADGTVNTTALQPDGKILIGGQFTTYNGTTVNRIARLNTDGILDTTFTTGTGADNSVNTITIQPDGKILVGGWFTTYNGTTVNGIARLNTDGTLDTTFTTGTGVDGAVSVIALQSDSKIFIGGDFYTYNGTTANRIARLNTDGTLDTTFTGTGANNYNVKAITFQPDGKILVGGDFIHYNDNPANRIVRLNTDGTLDTTFTIGTGASQVVYAVIIQPDGKILIGGQFLTYNGTTVNGIARLNTDGTLDTTFTAGTGIDNYTSVYTVAIQSDGKILIGGNFTTYNGTTVNYITRLNTDGTLDTTFTSTGTNSDVNTITFQPDGNKAIIGGSFTNYNGSSAAYLARILFAMDLPSDSTTLTTTIQSNISLSCTQSGQTNDTTLEFGTLTPGTPLTQSLTCAVTTNSPNGYTLTTQRNDADTTMDKTTDNTQNITDRTNWDPQNPNATLWQTNDTGLAFTVYNSTANKNTQWWGTGTSHTDTNNLYAGLPHTAQSIMTYTHYNQNTTTTDIAYKLDIPTTQQAGIYDGIVTYQATVNP